MVGFYNDPAYASITDTSITVDGITYPSILNYKLMGGDYHISYKPVAGKYVLENQGAGFIEFNNVDEFSGIIFESIKECGIELTCEQKSILTLCIERLIKNGTMLCFKPNRLKHYGEKHKYKCFVFEYPENSRKNTNYYNSINLGNIVDGIVMNIDAMQNFTGPVSDKYPFLKPAYLGELLNEPEAKNPGKELLESYGIYNGLNYLKSHEKHAIMQLLVDESNDAGLTTHDVSEYTLENIARKIEALTDEYVLNNYTTFGKEIVNFITSIVNIDVRNLGDNFSPNEIATFLNGHKIFMRMFLNVISSRVQTTFFPGVCDYQIDIVTNPDKFSILIIEFYNGNRRNVCKIG